MPQYNIQYIINYLKIKKKRINNHQLKAKLSFYKTLLVSMMFEPFLNIYFFHLTQKKIISNSDFTEFNSSLEGTGKRPVLHFANLRLCVFLNYRKLYLKSGMTVCGLGHIPVDLLNAR